MSKGWTIGGEKFRTTQELVERIVTLDEGNGVLIDRIRYLERLIRTMLKQDPLEYVADGGVTVLDVWREQAKAALRYTEPPE